MSSAQAQSGVVIINVATGHYDESVDITGDELAICGNGDVELTNSTSSFGVGIEHIVDLKLDTVHVHDHPAYGIRISAQNEQYSNLESGRITTRNLNLVSS